MFGVMGVLLIAGCGPRTLRDETQAIGAECVRSDRGITTGTYVCDSPGGPFDAVYEFRAESGGLHVALCNAGAFFGELHFTVDDPTLGTHTLGVSKSSLPAPCDGCDGWTNVGGTVDIEGYDPVSQTVCGTFDIPYRQREGTGTRRETGTFSAVVP